MESFTWFIGFWVVLANLLILSVQFFTLLSTVFIGTFTGKVFQTPPPKKTKTYQH